MVVSLEEGLLWEGLADHDEKGEEGPGGGARRGGG
jgi:hypothetical protein